jgi:hypothetical protein
VLQFDTTTWADTIILGQLSDRGFGLFTGAVWADVGAILGDQRALGSRGC